MGKLWENKKKWGGWLFPLFAKWIMNNIVFRYYKNKCVHSGMDGTKYRVQKLPKSEKVETFVETF